MGKGDRGKRRSKGKVDEALRKQAKRFRPVLEITPTAIAVTDLKNRVVSWNPAAERLFGYTVEEAAGRDLDDLVAGTEALHAEAAELSRRVAAREDVRGIGWRTRKDGTLLEVELHATPLLDDGEVIGTFAIYHDVTELNRQRRFFEALLEVSPEAIVTTDLNDVVTSWNPAAERLFGYRARDAVGRDIDDLVARHPEVHAEAKELSRSSMGAGSAHAVTRRTRQDGSLVDVDVVGGPVTVDGEPVAKHIFYHDISELQEQKRYFQSLLELNPAASIVTDLDVKVVSWNPGAEKIFGYRAEEAIGRHLDDLVANRADIHKEALRYSEAAARGERVQGTGRRTRKDGSLVDVLMFSEPVVVGEERVGFVVIYHDVTELQRERRFLEALFEQSPVAIALIAPNETVTSWNPAAERLFGYTAEEAVGRHIDDLVANRDEIREEARAYTERGIRGDLVHTITRRTRKDGTLVDVEMFGAPVIVGGEASGLFGMFHDIRELQQARREAEAATEAKSAFLATMSHEIRTPLNAVLGMTGLLLDTDLTPEQRNFAEVTRSSGDALLSVINDILDFSKIEAGRLDLDHAPFDLRECVESALELVAAGALRKGLDIAYDLDPNVPVALVGDVTRLRQVLINLLNNAVKFTERGEVVVTVTAERLEDAERWRVHFAVRDTGIGIPADRMDRLFESFSQLDPSTTRRYGGTGLGLAISRRLTELMGGTLWAESRQDEGSTFHFTIEAEASREPVKPFDPAVATQLSGRRVLIVDDNATNRQILSKQAESWGMLAVATETPAEALEWIRRGDPFDVAILDMQMPDMDGLTLAVEIRRDRDATALPLIMLTSLGRVDASSVEFAAHLTKPIKPSQLHDALMSIFGGEPDAETSAGVPGEDERLAERLPLRILVVEDNAVNQQLVLLMLQKVGYRADVAANGVEALEALERQPYDAVLMDVEMPEMDGLEATRRIHQRWPRQRRPHIVAVTANAMQGERELCIQAGMDDYITKPIHIDELTGALTRVTHRSDTTGPEASVDAAVIDRLAASLGDQGRESVGALLDTFLGRLPEQMRGLADAARHDDLDGVRREAHTLKSNAAQFGAGRLEQLCRELESAAKEGAPDRVRENLDRVGVEQERVAAELGAIRAGLAG
ncbi:MAG TPA: PAS domain S-box protein [Actinomycetota bacterium]